MKKLMITAAAAALLIPLSSCADNDADDDTRLSETEREEQQMTAAEREDETRVADAYGTSTTDVDADGMVTDPVDYTGTTYGAQGTTTPADLEARYEVSYIADDQISAKDLLGEGVIGIDGERIARVDDIVLGRSGEAEQLVFLSGGIFGLGGKRGALDYDRVDMMINADDDLRVRISMTDDAIKSVTEYETEEMNDYSLASELIGATAELTGSDDEEAVISDIILSDSGNATHLVVRDSTLGTTLGGYGRVIDFSKLTITAENELMLDITAASLDEAEVFSYARGS